MNEQVIAEKKTKKETKQKEKGTFKEPVEFTMLYSEDPFK